MFVPIGDGKFLKVNLKSYNFSPTFCWLAKFTKKIFPYGRVWGFFLPYICPIKLTALVNLFSPRIFWIYLSVKSFGRWLENMHRWSFFYVIFIEKGENVYQGKIERVYTQTKPECRLGCGVFLTKPVVGCADRGPVVNEPPRKDGKGVRHSVRMPARPLYRNIES